MTPRVCAVKRSMMIILVLFGTLPSASGQSSGPWHVESNDLDDLNDQANQMFEDKEVPVIMQYRQLTVSPTSTNRLTDPQKANLISRWEGVIAKQIEHEHFRSVSDAELHRGSRQGYDDLRRRLFESLPFGQQGMARDRINNDIRMLVDTRAACVQNGGVLLAITMGFNPTPGAVDEYGNAIFALIGTGRCGDRRDSYHERYINNIADRVVEHATEEIEGE